MEIKERNSPVMGINYGMLKIIGATFHKMLTVIKDLSVMTVMKTVTFHPLQHQDLMTVLSTVSHPGEILKWVAVTLTSANVLTERALSTHARAVQQFLWRESMRVIGEKTYFAVRDK